MAENLSFKCRIISSNIGQAKVRTRGRRVGFSGLRAPKGRHSPQVFQQGCLAMQVAKTASDADWEEASRREMVIRPLAHCARISAEVATEAMSTLGLQRSRFYELLQLYRAAPCAASLLPGKRGRTCGTRNLSADVEQLISRGIEEHYLTREKPSVQSLRRWLDHECRKSGIRPPSTKAITARVRALPPV